MRPWLVICLSSIAGCHGSTPDGIRTDAAPVEMRSANDAASTGDAAAADDAAACVDSCTQADGHRCSNGQLQTCARDAQDCLSWSTPTVCPDGFCEDAATCGTCNNPCAAGTTQCLKGALQTCVADGHGCRAWSAGTMCTDGFCQDAATCGTCSNQCAAGTPQSVNAPHQ